MVLRRPPHPTLKRAPDTGAMSQSAYDEQIDKLRSGE
jgi:hypothetical protein